MKFLKIDKIKKVYLLKFNDLTLASLRVFMAYNQLRSYEIVISWQQNDKNKINLSIFSKLIK
jgi:hypothetical protein